MAYGLDSVTFSNPAAEQDIYAYEWGVCLSAICMGIQTYLIG